MNLLMVLYEYDMTHTIAVSHIPSITMPSMDPELVEYVYTIETMTDGIILYRFVDKLTNRGVDMILDMGWCLMTTWIEPEHIHARQDMCVPDVSFRFGKDNMRLLVTADIYLPKHETVLLNIDADAPGSVVGIVPTTTTEMWKLRAIAIIGYGPCSNGRPGLCKPTKLPKLMIAGMDIEVSTHARERSMPLPHDPIISITISNGSWYDKTGTDICVCIYTFGYVRDVDLVDGRRPLFMKARSTGHAVELAYGVLDKMGYDFVNIHNAFGFDLKHMSANCAEIDGISDVFEKGRLGDFGSGMFMKLTNGCMIVDSLYTTIKMSRPGQWESFGLAYMASVLGLPPKLDVDGMMILPTDDYDLTDMLIYNCRDSDLHACPASKTPWNNVGQMVFCVQQSECLASGMCLDLSSTSESDEHQIEGGLVLDPIPGVYKGVIMIDGNSLYATIMSELGIFVDRCASSTTAAGLAEKMGVIIPTETKGMMVGDVIVRDSCIVMRTNDVYLGIVRGGPTIPSTIMKRMIADRRRARDDGDEELAYAYKQSTTAMFGATSSAHGTLSSKTCGEIITYMARYYLRKMIEITTSCGYKVIYGDTDSIFVHVGGETELSCMTTAMKIKTAISTQMLGTIFEKVGADVKGNYKSIAISSKKKYEGVLWNGSLDTKGLAPVKKDILPIVRFAMTKVLNIINSDDQDSEKRMKLVKLVGGIIHSVKSGVIPNKMMVIEKRINCQPHIVYVDDKGMTRSILIDIGGKITNVSSTWVMRRIRSAFDGLLTNMGMNNTSELLFAYNSMMREEC
ncbi:hypothetical protein F5Y03DRAFT_403558 [Xylaria venustula]|nr:hypothetical protein F5Y03DRAFT_403558 [Xylaria venustula]